MRQSLALVLALACAAVGGCFLGKPGHVTALLPGRAPFDGPTGEDVVLLRVALLERPTGDRCLNDELGRLADEQAITLADKVNLERKGELADNGFRMGQIGGQPPASLL